MSSIVPFARSAAPKSGDAAVAEFVKGFSLEAVPRTAAKLSELRGLLPQNTRIYLAHIDGVDFAEMHKAAETISSLGFSVMPHIPARSLTGTDQLEAWIRAYADLGINQALLIGGGRRNARSTLTNSMQMLETGLFDKYRFKRLHVAGHPEGNRDIDTDGSDAEVTKALKWKANFSENTDAEMAITTQFCFDTAPVIAWADRLKNQGIDLPIHIGVAGPARLQTLVRYALACGVGASIEVLRRRASDLTNLVRPFTPMSFLRELAEHKVTNPEFNIESVHFFPLGGITATTEFVTQLGTEEARQAAL